MGKVIVSAPSMRMATLQSLWPELVLSTQLHAELEQWEKDMKHQFAMSPSLKKELFESGALGPEYYKESASAFGSFVGKHQLEELAFQSIAIPDLSSYVFRTIGIGQGHDLEGLVSARGVFNVQISASDWAVSALENAVPVLSNLLHAHGLSHMTPESLLERAEIEQMIGLDAEEEWWPYQEGRLSVEEVKRTILWSISRVIQHRPEEPAIRILRGLGRALALNPLARVIVVHPYPEDELNHPLQQKYRTAYPYSLQFFLQYISEGAEVPCEELRRSQHDFMDWQCYTASTFGLSSKLYQ